MAMLFLPILQQQFGMFEMKGLDGAVVEVEEPPLSYQSYKDGTYQRQLDSYIAAHFGFHEPIIRLYNQYLLLFRKTYAADVVIGKDRWLYGKNSVLDHYGQLSSRYAESNETLEQNLRKNLLRLKSVQNKLEQRGTYLFVLICPSKDEVYPEHLPKYGPYVKCDGLRAIDYYPKAFVENGINFVDMCAWFQQIKDTASYPLFPKYGMHWSNIACAHASDSLIRYMEYLTGINAPNIKIGSMYPDATRQPDSDLEQNLNLAWGIVPVEQNYYADIEVIPDSSAQRLRLITMGDSFFWNMCYTLPMDDIFETYHYWYYFNTIFNDPNHNNVSQINLIEELDKADVVMISLSATQLYDISHGFLSQALLLLSSPSQGTLNAILEGIKRDMEASEEWYQALKAKAAQQDRPLEQVMDEDARYMYNQTPEKYIMKEALESIKRGMRNSPEWYEALLEKARQNGKSIEQVLDEDALYILNQEPEKYLN